MSDHTPTPWKLTKVQGTYFYVEWGGETVVQVDHDSSNAVNEANAEFIVRACNAHDELVAAAREAMDVLCSLDRSPVDDSTIDRLDAAIVKADARGVDNEITTHKKLNEKIESIEFVDGGPNVPLLKITKFSKPRGDGSE